MKKIVSCLMTLALMVSPMAMAAEEVTRPSDEALMLDCMTIIAGKDASATGRVFVGHNEDDNGRCVVHHGYVEAVDWQEDAIIPSEEGRAAIPQVAHTYGYYWSQVRSATRGLSGADIFLNENGVCIVTNNNADSRADMNDDSRLTDGGIEYNMRRILAERSVSARDALNIVIEMVETWGYAPSGRAYTVADSEEAFMIQIVSGRRYIAARIPDDMVVVMPNHYTFHGLDDVEEMYYSEDLVTYAIEMGWYTPTVEGDFSDFDFALAYQDEYSYGRDYNVLRQKYAMEILLGREWDTAQDVLPFAFKPDNPISMENMMAVLSTHYEGTIHEDGFGPGNSPHDTETRKICTGTTIEATIFDLAEEPLLTTAWTAFGRPCQLPFLPMHPLAGTVDEIDKMEDSAFEMAEHLQYHAQATVYQNNGWQSMRNFENLQEMVYSDTIQGVTEMKNEMYAEYAEANGILISETATLLAENKKDEAKTKLNDADKNTAIACIERLNTYAEENFRMVEISEHTPFSLSWPDMPYTLIFSCDSKPVESEIYFGMGFTNVRQKYAPALSGTLVDMGDGMYSVSFDPFVMMDSAACAGEYEFFIGGKTEDGRAFTGMTVLSFID